MYSFSIHFINKTILHLHKQKIMKDAFQLLISLFPLLISVIAAWLVIDFYLIFRKYILLKMKYYQKN